MRLILLNLMQVISDNLVVKDSGGKQLESQLLPLLNASISLRNYYSKAYLGIAPNVTPKYWLAFSASLPPLGFNTYIISSTTSTLERPGEPDDCNIQDIHRKKILGQLFRKCFFILVFLLAAASTSERVYGSEASQNDTVEVGPGNLKLIFSGDGKLAQYINSRSLVCNIG